MKSDRISTFPRQFNPLRDQLFERAKTSPEFLASVFTKVEGDAPTDDEIMQSVENRLFSLIHDYPAWFGKIDNSRHRRAQRAYAIGRGQITPNQQPEHLRRRRLSIEAQIALDEAEASTVA